MGDNLKTLKSNKPKQNLRNIKQTFIKDTNLEPSIKYEIAKEQYVKKDQKRKY